MHAYTLSAHLSKHQTLADSGGSRGSASSQLNQLALHQRSCAAFAGLPASSRYCCFAPAGQHALQHLLGLEPKPLREELDL